MQAKSQTNPHQHGRQMARNRQSEPRPQQQHGQRCNPHQGISPLPAGHGAGQCLDLAQIGFRHMRNAQAEEILDLQGGDHNGNTTGKPQRY